jgi:CheY-like chemotaxis protein
MAGRGILVVDDERDIREVLQTALEMEGYRVQTAANGKEALALLEREPGLQLVLLDLMMPVMNGLEFLGTVRRDPRLQDLPVVVVSAFGQMVRDGALQALGPQGFMEKPVQFQALLDVVSRHCGPPPAGG